MYLCDIDRRTIGRGTFHLYAIGDMHADRKEFDEPRFKQYIAHIASDPSAVAIFVGDALDGRIPGMKHFDADTVRPNFLGNLKAYIPYGAEICANYLRPIVKAGVPLVVISGNHDEYIEGGGFSTLLVREIGTKHCHYLGGEGFVRIRSGKQRPSDRETAPLYTTVVYATHGTGGGKTPGPKVNAMQRYYEWVDADVVMAGHVHDGSVRIIPSYGVSRMGALTLRETPRVMYRATSFVKRSVEGVVGYQGKKGYPSSDMGLQWIVIDPMAHTAYRQECEF